MSGSRAPGSGDATGRAPGRPRLTRLLAPILLIAVAVPYSITAFTLWNATGQDLGVVRKEREGVALMRPLVTLVAATADAQSAAIAGRPVDADRVRALIGEVDAGNDRVGAQLGTDRRWGQVRTRLEAALSAAPTGVAAYTTFSQVVDLERELVAAVGDSSQLVLDPSLDSYYLMDTALLRIPALLVQAGRATDLTVLAERPASARPDDRIQAAVAIAETQAQAEAINTGLRKSFAAGHQDSLGSDLPSALERLHDTASSFAPPTAAVGATVAVRTSSELQVSRARLRDAATGILSASLEQLDRLLADRSASISSGRSLATAGTAAGGLVAALALWFLGPRRRTATGATAPDSTAAAGRSPQAAAESGPATAPEPAETTDPAETGDLLEARELLTAQRLIRVGRAVSPTREKQ